MIDVEKYKVLTEKEDWETVYALLDEARENAVTADDRSTEMVLRVNALSKQQRYDEALDLRRSKKKPYNSQCLAQHDRARLLLRLGRDALHALGEAPFEAEVTSFYVLAMDAKFFYLTLLAKAGDLSVKDRLSEIPDDDWHITMDGDSLRKPDIVALLG